MNEFKDVFENMHTAPYEIITVNRKKENGLNNMIVVVGAISMILVAIEIEKRINIRISKYDRGKEE
jgi:hypothetical protein